MPAKFIHAKYNLKQLGKKCGGYIPLVGMIMITALTTLKLTALPSSAETTSSVTVDSGCSLVSEVSTEHAGTIINGVYSEIPGSTTISSVCNGAYDSQISAIGFSNDTDGNINLISDSSTIPGNTPFPDNASDFTNNSPSGWYMKLTSTNNLLAIDNDFDSYHTIPDSSIKVASTKLTTDGSTKLGFTTKYSAYISTNQPAGIYTGKVKYTLSTTASKLVTTITDGVSTYMQEISSKAEGGCPDTIETGKAYQLTDSRDNEVYYVARLADGNCWMLDNLRLGSDSKITLTSSNSNTNGNYELPAGITSGFNYHYTVAHINSANKNKTTTSYGSGSGKVGVYYNYCAASAGTICMSSNSGSSAQYDVCPAGWRMPTGGSSGEYQALYAAYSSNATNFRNALSTPLSGYFLGESQGSLGSRGNFWSSTYYNTDYMCHLFVNLSGINPQNASSRYIGFSVRCVLK